MKNFIGILSLICIISSNCFASVNGHSHIFIFHINGINTTFPQATDNAYELIKAANISSNMVSWDLLYNATSGIWDDLDDVFAQKAQEGKKITIDDFVVAYMKSHHLDYKIGSKEFNKLKGTIKKRYLKDKNFVGRNFQDIVDQFHNKIPAMYSPVVETLRKYNAINPNGAYVLLLPHSQGNLYANQLYNYLIQAEQFPQNHLAVFGIAKSCKQRTKLYTTL